MAQGQYGAVGVLDLDSFHCSSLSGLCSWLAHDPRWYFSRPSQTIHIPAGRMEEKGRADTFHLRIFYINLIPFPLKSC